MERFHCQLKASLDHGQSQALALALLTTQHSRGICSAVQLSYLYDATLRLPGEFFQKGPENAQVDSTSFVARLRDIMRKLKATPVRSSQSQHNVPRAAHMYFRNDSVRKPLQRQYSGPYKVVNRTTMVDCNGHQDTDQIKLAENPVTFFTNSITSSAVNNQDYSLWQMSALP